MYFGFTNVVVAFMELTNRLFKTYIDMYVTVFIKDILMYSRNEEDHVNNLKIVF